MPAQGIASVLSQSFNVEGLKQGIFSATGAAQKPGATKYLPAIIPNPMEQFASYTVLWTLSVLNKEQFNNPSSYRAAGVGFAGAGSVVFSSAGRGDAFRTKTFYGSPEYFIDNFKMKTIIAANSKSGNSNAIKFEFDIYEPYSMGLLLQSLQVAAKKAGFVNYLDNAPYCLKMDVEGWDEKGKKTVNINSKYFTLKLTKVTFKVTESGSQYQVEAIPYNHQGFSDVNNTTYSDIKIVAGSAGTVEEVLSTGNQSLSRVLNDIEEKLQKEKLIRVKDEYVIQFPENAGDFQRNTPPPASNKATSNPNAPAPTSIGSAGIFLGGGGGVNPIGKSSLGFTSGSGGNVPFSKHGDVVDEKTGLVQRDNMTVDPKNRAFQFAQGQKITAMINQLILSSEYAKKALDANNLIDGFVKWWRIDMQVELLDFDTQVGDYAKRMIFRVVPWLVHHTVFTDPNTVPLGYNSLEKRIVKQYSYIYTGQNTDILKFDIEINTMFFTGVNPSVESQSAQVSNLGQKGPAEPKVDSVEGGTTSKPQAQETTIGRPRPKRDPNLLIKPVGGADDKNTAQVIAESFHAALTGSAGVDMVKVNLEVLGDPYWLVDSGIGNYFAAAAPTSQVTSDGTMNYEGGDVFVYLTFRNPVDINEKQGIYEFAKDGRDSAFSGIYKVIQCENVFSQGVWKQILQCVRMVGQSTDYIVGGQPIGGLSEQQSEDVMPRRTGDPEPPSTSPNDDEAASGTFTI